MEEYPLFILDNGGYQYKAGFSQDDKPLVFPNGLVKCKNDRKRLYIGSEFAELQDKVGLYYQMAFEKGYLVNWDVEFQVWEQMFSANCFNLSLCDTDLVLTDPNCNIPAVKDCSYEVVYEYFGFNGLYKTSSSGLVALDSLRRENKKLCLVIDSGYSFTHILPYVDGKLVADNVVRIDVGGKLLTNQLKDWITYRQLNVLEETYIINQVKEDCCFVSLSTKLDFEIARRSFPYNTIKCEYVLPDYVTLSKGQKLSPGQFSTAKYPDNQMIMLNTERFVIPEILFNPSGIEINQMGISEAVNYVVDKFNEPFQGGLFSNIKPIGGNVLFKGFRDRLYSDVRSNCDASFNVSVNMSVNPLEEAWFCGKSNAEYLRKQLISKKEYDEHGVNYCKKKFLDFYHLND
uniref:Actin-like protein (inferred by orthology to a C. elegans protein) n=1 Tax=Strongyloides venezuelensis TaxID=75913 RepID=A0A0K0FIC1_STRVS